jgi:hypothetical protein
MTRGSALRSDVGHSLTEGSFLTSLLWILHGKELGMTSEEIGGYIIVACWGLMLWGAIKVFGFRRVALVTIWFVVFAVGIAFRTLGAFTDTRRY